ncbi:wif1, partial [Symbiodinium pilosum]
VYFFRTGAIIFWHQPTEWLVGSTILEGDNSQPATYGAKPLLAFALSAFALVHRICGMFRWQLKWVGEGVLNAKVDHGVGELQMDREDWLFGHIPCCPATSLQDVTQNATKGPGDWFHIAFVWDLGVGLAGQGRTYLWVDGIEAMPAELNSERLTHFIWVDPEEGLDLGGIRSPMSPGEYSPLPLKRTFLISFAYMFLKGNIRVYTRALTAEQVLDQPAASFLSISFFGSCSIRQVYEIYSQEVGVIRKWFTSGAGCQQDPTCGMTDDVCPTPWSYRYVREVTNPNDFRYKLFPRRPAAEANKTSQLRHGIPHPCASRLPDLCSLSGTSEDHFQDPKTRPESWYFRLPSELGNLRQRS